MKWSLMLVDVFVIEMRRITQTHTHTVLISSLVQTLCYYAHYNASAGTNIVLCKDMICEWVIALLCIVLIRWIRLRVFWVQSLYVGVEFQRTNWSVTGHPDSEYKDCYTRMKIRMISVTLCDGRFCRNGTLKFNADRLNRSWECALVVLLLCDSDLQVSLPPKMHELSISVLTL